MKKNGFTLIGVSIAIGLFSFFFLVILASLNSVDSTMSQNRLISTRDRILSGVRSIAGIPAALRNSMLASNPAGAPMNPQLLACAGGNPLNSCDSNTVYPLTLYSPVVVFNGTNPSYVQPVSSALGTVNPTLRFDAYGTPCQTNGPECPLLVFTSFKATCSPPFHPVAAPITNASFIPQAKCSVAESIEVTFQIQLDPALVAANPSLASFITTLTGSVTVSVEQISGNVPF